MSDEKIDYNRFAEDLLEAAARYDMGDIDQAVEDEDFGRMQVLKDFAERRLNISLTPEAAVGLNRLTRSPGNSEPDEIASHLEQLLAANK